MLLSVSKAAVKKNPKTQIFHKIFHLLKKGAFCLPENRCIPPLLGWKIKKNTAKQKYFWKLLAMLPAVFLFSNIDNQAS